jgi:hypothetical protein
MDGSFVTRANRRREIPASQTEGDIHKADQRRDFDERADQADESLAGVQSEHSDCDRDSQFKIVTCRSWRKKVAMLTSLELFCLLPAIGAVIFIVTVAEDDFHSHHHHHS